MSDAPPETRYAAVRCAVETMREARTTADLTRIAVREVVRMGFDRCLISRIVDAHWVPLAAWSSAGQEGAVAMVDVGTQANRLLDSSLLESDVVRSRAPMLVLHAQSNPRVHDELKSLNGTTSYVVAPIIAAGAVVGFLHVDHLPHKHEVDETDLDVLGIFAAALGVAVERAYLEERLTFLTGQVKALGAGVPDLVGGRRPPVTTDILDMIGAEVSGATTLTDLLTPREQEVLDHLADGETNRTIAQRLYLSEATVKVHVKHVLRKLGATNRGEAISLYLRRS